MLKRDTQDKKAQELEGIDSKGGKIMKTTKILYLVASICMVLVMIISMVLAACAKEEAPAPAAPAPAPAVEVYNWKMTTCGATVTPWHYNNEILVDMVEAMSDGRIEIELHALATLFDPKDTVANVEQGVVELAMQFADYNVGKDGRFRLMCYIVGNPLDIGEELLFQRSGYLDMIKELYAEYDCYVFGKMFFSQEQFLSKKPVTKVADFKGLKVRASGPGEMLFKELGALPTYITSSEAYTAIQLGTIDGGDVTGAKGNWDMGLHEVTSYIIIPPVYNVAGGAAADWIINMDLWNSLSSDLQAILEGAAGIAGIESWIVERRQNLEYHQKMIDYGLEVLTIPESEMAVINKAKVKVWDELAAMDPVSEKIIKLIKETCAFVGKPM